MNIHLRQRLSEARQTRLRTTDGCIRPAGVCPIHQDGNPIAHYNDTRECDQVQTKDQQPYPSGMGAFNPGIRNVG